MHATLLNLKQEYLSELVENTTNTKQQVTFVFEGKEGDKKSQAAKYIFLKSIKGLMCLKLITYDAENVLCILDITCIYIRAL